MEAVRIASTLETGNAVEQRAFKSARKEEAKRKWHERKMCGQFVREKGETVQHIVSEFNKLSQHEYKKSLSTGSYVKCSILIGVINGMNTALKDQLRMRM